MKSRLLLILMIMIVALTGSAYAINTDVDYDTLRESYIAVPDNYIADINAPCPVLVYVEDPANPGNGWPGATVRLVILSGSIEYLIPSSGEQTTNQLGIAEFGIASSVHGPVDLLLVNQSNNNTVIANATVNFQQLSELNSELVANTLTAVADSVSSVLLTTIFRDIDNQPIPNVPRFDIFSSDTPVPQVFNVLVTGSHNYLTYLSDQSDAAGMMHVILRSTTAETKGATSKWNTYTLGNVPNIVFTAGPISAMRTTVDATSPVTANGMDRSTVTITVKDAHGNAIAGVAANRFTVAVSGNHNTVYGPFQPTNVNGITTAQVSSTRIGEKTVTVTVINNNGQPLQLNDTGTIVFWSGPLDPTTSNVIVQSPVVADSIAQAQISIVLLDANNNPPFPSSIGSSSIQISATGLHNVITQPFEDTDINGFTYGFISSTRAEEKQIIVVVAGDTLEAQPIVEFLPGDPSVNTSLVAATGPIHSNGAETSQLTLTLKDRFANVIPGFPGANVQFMVNPVNGININNPAVATDEMGNAYGTFTSTMTGTKTVTARYNFDGEWHPVVDNAVVEVIPDITNADLSVVTVSETTTADNVDECFIYIQLMDSQNNPIPEVPAEEIFIEISGDTNNLMPLEGMTNENGEIQTTFTSNVAEDKIVTITAQGVTLTTQAVAHFVPGPVNADHSSVMASGFPQVANAVDADTLTITLRDIFDNPVPNFPAGSISIVVSGSQNFVTAPANTNASGVTRVYVRSSRAETKTATVTIQQGGQLPLADQPELIFIPGPVSLSNSLVTATSPHVVDVDSTTIMITLRDAHENPIQLSQNYISIDPAPSAAFWGTGPDGIGTAKYTQNTAAEVTFTVTVEPLGEEPLELLQHPVVTFLPDDPDAERCQLSATSPVTVGVQDSCVVTLTVKDVHGNVISGLSRAFISFQISGSNNTPTTGTFMSNYTDANGQIQMYFKSTRAEDKTVSAMVDGVQVVDQTTTTFLAGPVHNLNSQVTATSPVIADGLSRSYITYTLKDEFQNPIPGVHRDDFDIMITETDTSSFQLSYDPQSLDETNTAGQVQWYLTSFTAEQLTITTVVTEVLLEDAPTVTFLPNDVSAQHTTISVSPDSVRADSVSVATITITVRNANNNPIQGVTPEAIELSVTGEENFLIPPMNTTNSQGRTEAYLSSYKAELKEILATVSGITIDDNAYVTFYAGPYSFNHSTATATSPVIADGQARSTVTITLRDKYDNPIVDFNPVDDDEFDHEGIVVSVVSADSLDALAVIQPTLRTDSAGRTFAYISSTVQQTVGLQVTVTTDDTTIEGIPISGNPIIEFIYEVDALNSTVLVQPSMVYANDRDSAEVHVYLRSTSGSPVAGMPVAIFTDRNVPGFDVVDRIEKPSVTDAGGHSVGYVRSAVEGIAELSVVVADSIVLETNASINFVQAPPANFDTDLLGAEPNIFVPDSDDASINRVRINIPVESIPDNQDFEVDIFDMGGSRLVSLPVHYDGVRGVFFAIWDGNDDNGDPASSGAYIYQADVDGTEILNGIVGLAR